MIHLAQYTPKAIFKSKFLLNRHFIGSIFEQVFVFNLFS